MELAFKRNPRQQTLLHGPHSSQGSRHVFRLIPTKTILEGSSSDCHNPDKAGGSKVSLTDWQHCVSRYPVALGVSTTFGPNFSTGKNTLVKIGEIVATFSFNICEADGGDVRCELVSPAQLITWYWQTSGPAWK